MAVAGGIAGVPAGIGDWAVVEAGRHEDVIESRYFLAATS